MSEALQVAWRATNSWLDGLAERPVNARASLADLRRHFGGALPTRGTGAHEVVRDLAEKAAPGMLGNASGRFFAWVIGGSLESALGADWLVSAWDQNAALYACSPAAAILEETAGEWIKDLLDLPREASFAFTTGCQLAHATAFAAARHALLKRAGWNVEEKGLWGAPRIRVLTSDQKHGSVERAVRLLGFGRDAIEPLPTNGEGRIEPQALCGALAQRDAAVLLVLNAADLNIGACDSFPDLIPIAREAGAWVHIDGAFGLFARASRSYRHHLEGVQLADSWATDAHKWLNVPFDCGIAIVRDYEAHRASMTQSASYIAPAASARDQIDWNPEWSRRARGIPVYAALRELGRDGVEAMIDRCCALCRELVERIGALEGAEVACRPTLNQGLVRFVRLGASDDVNDAFTDEIISRINTTGEAYFSGTTWRGRRAMRVSVVNWRTTAEDVKRASAAVASVLAEVGASSVRCTWRWAHL